MTTYVIRRLIQAIPILIGIATHLIPIAHLAPGSPIDKFRTPRVSQEMLDNLYRMYGLDKSLPEQFIRLVLQLHPAVADGRRRQPHRLGLLLLVG